MNGADDDVPSRPVEGQTLVNLAWAGTGLFVASSTAAAIAPDALGLASAVVACVLFAIGCVAFLWAYALGVTRSRDEQVSLAGLFFLSGSAPRAVAFRLRLALAVQIVAATVTASVRPFTDLAFGVLVPVFGLGMMSLWGGRHGTFAAREPGERG